MPPKPSVDLEEIRKMFSELNSKIDNIVTETKDINSKLVELGVEQNRLRADMEKENSELKLDIVAARCRRLEDEQKKKNLTISGLEASRNSNKDVNEIFKQIGVEVGLTHDYMCTVKIDQINRMKKKNSGEPGDIIVKLCNLSDKDSILKTAKITKSKNFYLREDFSRETRNIRKQLTTPLLNARKEKLKAYLRADKLIVEKDGKKNIYTYDETEDGLKTLQNNFKLDLAKLLAEELDETEIGLDDENE